MCSFLCASGVTRDELEKVKSHQKCPIFLDDISNILSVFTSRDHLRVRNVSKFFLRNV